jgi:YHS domain-containing protein
MLVSPAFAASGEYNNMDALGLTNGKGMWTKCDVSGQYQGKTNCFGSEERKVEFMKQPETYRAKADAFCTAKARDPNWQPCDYDPVDPNSPTRATNVARDLQKQQQGRPSSRVGAPFLTPVPEPSTSVSL